MVRRAKSKVGSAADAPPDASAGETASKPKKPRARRQRAKRRAKPAPRSASLAKAKQVRKAIRPSRRRRYSDAERRTVLDTAKREGLTALEVQKRFGVTPVTYYSWRKKSGGGNRRRRAVAAGAAVGRTMAGAVNLAEAIREEVRGHIRRHLPEILRHEIGAAFSQGGRRKQTRR